MSFNYIFFDLDGTLTDPQEGITKCVQYALDYLGIHENTDNLLKFIGPPLFDSFIDFYEMDDETAEIAVEKYRERFSVTGMFENKVYDGIYELLEKLSKKNKTMCIVSSKPLIFTEEILKKFNLRDYFLYISCPGLEKNSKTKSELINDTLKLLKIDNKNKEKVIMVGDRKYDVIGAKNCRIFSVGVEYGFAEEKELENAGADFIAYTVKDLYNILLCP